MSTSIDAALVRQYEKEVHLAFQRQGSYLKNCTRFKPDILGKSTTFQKLGTGIATTKARHGAITPMNQDHTAIECTLQDFYAGDWVDKLDEAKTNIDERMALAKSGAMALGRKVDDLIITALDATTESIVTITVTSYAAIRNGLITMVEALNANKVPDDGERYGILTPRMWSQAMTVKEFNSSDWVGPSGMAFTEGAPSGPARFKEWMGVKWRMQTDLPGEGTATAKSFVWHQRAIGFAAGKHAGNIATNEGVAADIQWYNTHGAHFIMHSMSGGAALIDTEGVIEANSDDTAAIATA